MKMKKKYNLSVPEKASNTWIFTHKVYKEICDTIGRRKPEYGGILGSSDGKHIDHYYFDSTSERSAGFYKMDIPVVNKIVRGWNDNDVELIGVIHSHPQGVIKPSMGDYEMAKHIIETINVHGKFFTPIVQVSPRLNGEIKIYPYTFEQNVSMKEQYIKIEEAPKFTEEELRLKELASKAPNRFKRIEGILPPNIMEQKKVVCVGCGGSLEFLESLARHGIGTFYLFDGDTVTDTNIATQAANILDIGKRKVDVAKERIQNINPTAKVICYNMNLDDKITDDDFARLISLNDCGLKCTLLCGCTDNFFAQDRCAQLSYKYGLPYLAAQIFEKGKGHEVLFYYPGVTRSCPRCVLETRYKKMLTQKVENGGTGSSADAPIAVTNYLNAIKTYLALYMLCYNNETTAYFHKLDKYADCNYFMTKCSDEFSAPAFMPLEELEKREGDLLFPFVTCAIGQTPEKDCPICSLGTDEIGIVKNKIPDTRVIINNYDTNE